MARRTPGRPQPARGSSQTSGLLLSRVFTFLVFTLLPPTNTLVEGRSSRADVHEGDRGLFKNFWAGVSVGVTNAISYSGCSACENVLDFVVNTEDDDDGDDDGGLAPTTVKIVGMGLGRTGSTSLAMAFDVLGYHPYHDDELSRVPMPAESDDDPLTDAEVERMWLDHFDRVGQAGFDVSFRTPLDVALKKGAKVILTVRDDADKYAVSWANGPLYFATVMYSAPFKWMKPVQAMYPWIQEEFYQEPTTLYGHEPRPDQYLNQSFLAEVYLDHNEHVKAVVPPDRLLVFNAKDGWAPLCEFLGVPIPSGDSEGTPLLRPSILVYIATLSTFSLS